MIFSINRNAKTVRFGSIARMAYCVEAEGDSKILFNQQPCKYIFSTNCG